MVETQVLDKLEEVHSSLTMDKNQSERHSQVQQEEEDTSSYTFNLYEKEVSWKRISNEKQNDGTIKEVQED